MLMCSLLQLFYLPMALAIPPPAFLVHKQFSLLYQFWIHTEVRWGEGGEVGRGE